MRFASRTVAIMLFTFLALAGLTRGRAGAILPTNEPDPYQIAPSMRQYTHVYETSQHAPALELSQRISSRLGGAWKVHTWNPYSNDPRRVYGSGIDLAPGGIRTAEQAEQVARDFIRANPDFFGGARVENLATYRVTNAMGKWAVLLQQTVQGIPVNEAIVTLTLTESGRLFMFGSNYYDGVALPASSFIPREMAVAIARDAVPYDALSPMECVEDATMILPVLEENGDEETLRFRVTHMTEVPTSEPYGLYRTWVDAVTGEIVRRENQVTHAYSGQVQGDVEIPTYCSGNTANTPFAHMNVNITGVGVAETDASGNFSIAGSGPSRSFTAQFDGPVVNVNCSGCAGGDALFSGTIDADVPEAIYFPSGTYRADERDCFYFINKTSDYVKSIDPSWSYPKITANVNLNNTCNANWGGTILNFFRTGGGCHNTGEIGDVMGHEFGHCIQASLNGGSQGPNGQGEGNGDIAGTFVIDGSTIGIGFVSCSNGLSCPGPSCRDCENTLQWPTDAVGREVHDAGRVICGFNWDVWEGMVDKYGAAVGKEKTAQMWHFSRKMFGNSGYDQDDQAFDYFVINDNDGNLDNGTPDYVEICEGAMNHGFPCPTILAGVFITHTALPSTNDFDDPYVLTAIITSTEGSLNSDSLLVRYRINATGDYTATALVPTGNPNEYTASIPAQPCGNTVDYFLVAEDVFANRKTAPESAPVSTFLFNVANVIYVQDFEAASDWTTDPTHTATTGAFVRLDPNPSGFQPGDDTTPTPGVNAWFTAQNFQGSNFVDDVDMGIAATRSPVFDVTGLANVKLTMSWFHGQQDPGDDPAGDFFRIQLSNDGGATYPVNLVSIGDVATPAGWQVLSVDLGTAITLTDQMRLRIQVSDAAPSGDIIEGGIDDVTITGCPPQSPDTQAPVVSVIVPNGNEALVAGSTVPINWTANDNIGVTGVDILYSQNGGLSYPTTIATGEPNDGDYSWDLSGIPATNMARIKIVAADAALNAGEDASDANFTIGPPTSSIPEITLTAPNGGEAIDGQSVYPITWTASDDNGVTGVDIFLSTDGGATFDQVIAEDAPNTGSYGWSVSDEPTTQARIRVVAQDANFQQAADASDTDFTITINVTDVPPVVVPDKAFLGTTVPEPFVDHTQVRFGLAQAGPVTLAVYSIEGRVIRELMSGVLGAGTFDASWDGRDAAGNAVTSGRYFLKLSTAEGVLTKTMTLMR